MNSHSKTVKTLRVLISLLVCFGFIAWPQVGTQANTELSQANAEFATTAQQTTALISAGSTWKYLDNGSDQAAGWTGATFDDSKWKSGPAELGYGDGDEKTVVSFGSNSKAKYITTYFRQLITIENAAAVSALKLRMKRDDGAVIYINGKEAARSNVPSGEVNYKTLAKDTTTNLLFEADLNAAGLVNGVNAIAVEIHQSSATSTDISFDMELIATLVDAPAPTAVPTTAPTSAPTTAPTSGATPPAPTSGTLLAAGASWKYLDNGSDQGTAWSQPGFADTAWASGSAELGYGDGDEKTVVNYGTSSSSKFITTYFRSTFTLDNPASVSGLNLALKRDDGAVVYLNGREALRSNMPSGTIAYKTLAAAAASSQSLTASLDPALLVAGKNVIAVEVHQSSASSTDISFDLQLMAGAPGTAPTTAPTVAPTTAPTTQPATPPPATSGKSWYVTPNGSSSGSGSMSSPWSLAKALSHPSSVQPGDTIWVRAGTYGSGGEQDFESKLHGASGKYITVRAYPGERVVINGGVSISAEYSIFWGFEILNSNSDRSSSESGSHPGDVARSDGLSVYSSNTKLINNYVHDTNGMSAWETATNVELYGNIVSNSGWKGPDRGHGHGLYMQNETGTKTVVDNIIFNNYSGYNLHIYTERANIKGFYLEGNVSLNGQMLIAGSTPAARINLTGNTSYNGRARFGYTNSVTNQDLILKNNTFYSPGENALEVNRWKTLNITGNTVVSSSAKNVSYTSLSGASCGWNNNKYYAGASSPFAVNSSSKTWDSWRSATGFDGSSSYKNGGLSGVQVVVRPNKYETKRANVIVYNWDRQNSVMVDLSNTGLQSGDTYVLHNAFNYTETVKGTYNGQPVSVPMTGWTISKPTGASSPLGSSSFPQFGAFVLNTQ